MEKWIYLIAIITFKTSEEAYFAQDLKNAAEQLDSFGSDGWQVATVFPIEPDGKARVIFKKPSPQF